MTLWPEINFETDISLSQHYWNKVFAASPEDEPSSPAWDSSKPIPRPDTAESVPQPRELRVPVGGWNQDLPPSTCAKRHAKDRKTPFKANPERRKEACAFIQARYKEDSKDPFVFLYCDRYGRGTDSRYIDFTGPDSDVTDRVREFWHSLHKVRAIVSADRIAALSAGRFNTNCLIYMMRCRLIRVLSDTTPAELISQRQPNPTSVDQKAFVRPIFIEPILLATPSTGERAVMQQFIRYLRARSTVCDLAPDYFVTLPDDFWDV